jgi:hypothetical protein
VSRLGPRANPQTREGLAVSIKNKYNLSPSSGSCVRCGIERALEALQTAGSIQVHFIIKMKNLCGYVSSILFSMLIFYKKASCAGFMMSALAHHILGLTHGLDKLTLRQHM